MSDRPSFWCSSFPRFWWWLLALLGLPLLLFLMNYYQQPRIEADLTERVSSALATENIDWAEVDLQGRGRDVLLRGQPDSDIERERAREIVLGVQGVNAVDFAGAYLPADGDQTSDKQQQDAARQTAETGDNEPAQQTEMLSAVTTDSENEASEAVEQSADATELATDNSNNSNNTDTPADTAQENAETEGLPPELTLTMQDEQLILDGKMASQQQIAALQQQAALQVGVTNVVNNLTVDEAYAEADWLDTVTRMMAALPAGSELAVTDGQLILSGEVAEAETAEQLVVQAAQLLQGSELRLDNDLQVAEKSTEAPAVPEAGTQTAAQAEACQSRLDTAMQDRKIQFTFNDASITRASNALLDDLAQIISECSTAMAGRVIVIGGHTDSVGRDNYNLELSQRRANAVRDYLLGKQIDAALLEAKGFGESQPVAPNNNARNQAKNRRITFEIKQR